MSSAPSKVLYIQRSLPGIRDHSPENSWFFSICSTRTILSSWRVAARSNGAASSWHVKGVHCVRRRKTEGEITETREIVCVNFRFHVRLSFQRNISTLTFATWLIRRIMNVAHNANSEFCLILCTKQNVSSRTACVARTTNELCFWFVFWWNARGPSKVYMYNAFLF